jgi:hypothetical protein
VLVSNFSNGRKPELLGVAFNRLMRMNVDSGESLKTWRFSQMKKWHVNWEIRHLKVGNSLIQEDIELSFMNASTRGTVLSKYLYVCSINAKCVSRLELMTSQIVKSTLFYFKILQDLF